MFPLNQTPTPLWVCDLKPPILVTYKKEPFEFWLRVDLPLPDPPRFQSDLVIKHSDINPFDILGTPCFSISTLCTTSVLSYSSLEHYVEVLTTCLDTRFANQDPELLYGLKRWFTYSFKSL